MATPIGREPATNHGSHARVEAAHDLDHALERLPEAQREVVLLHWMQGLSYAEIGPIVGATPLAVRVRAHRAYAALRGVLQAGNKAPDSGISSKQ